MLPPNTRVEIVFFLGEAGSAQEASALHKRGDRARPIWNEVLSEVRRHWDAILGAVQVKTPDRAMDIMLNGLAAISNAVLPHLGPLGVLSGERCY